jgi:K+-sensing histidine kinase KdpD
MLVIKADLSKTGAFGCAISWTLSVVPMLLAVWLRLSLVPVRAGLQYEIFFPAVTIAAMVRGYLSGLFATGLGLAFATSIFRTPYYTLSLELLRTSLWSYLDFLTDGVIISFSIEAMHRSGSTMQSRTKCL